MDLAAIEAEMRRAIGTRKVSEDYVAPTLVERLAVTLECEGDPPRAGAPLPPTWHTIFCLQTPARSELGDDGLPRRYDLIPPVPMQRRLFGGARLEFHAPLRVGEKVTCESELSDVKVRSTPGAHLAVATLRHRFFGGAGLAVVEEQDIIHMEPIPGGGKSGGPPKADNRTDNKNDSNADVRAAGTWQRTIMVDSVTLFRFSALTFNSHRVHYDVPYAEGVEKLPKLVVQSKLIALALVETMRRAAPEAELATFQYRSTRPLYAGTPCTLAATLGEDRSSMQLWAQDEAAAMVQTASLTLTKPLRA
jgi:3-methylfumaryl-CoA hydratase